MPLDERDYMHQPRLKGLDEHPTPPTPSRWRRRSPPTRAPRDTPIPVIFGRLLATAIAIAATPLHLASWIDPGRIAVAARQCPYPALDVALTDIPWILFGVNVATALIALAFFTIRRHSLWPARTFVWLALIVETILFAHAAMGFPLDAYHGFPEL